jgi:hypothetical protein
MATTTKITKKKISIKLIGLIVGVVILAALAVLLYIIANPSAETVFKDMNSKMLETKSVTINNQLVMTGQGQIDSSLYVDYSSSTKLLEKGTFSFSILSNTSPMTVGGNLIKIGDDTYVKYSEISSTSSDLASSFSAVQSRFENKWVKVGSTDQFAMFATTPLEFASSILPMPYANLNEAQRKTVVAILQDKSTYTISESTKVDVAGVAAYKYVIAYNKDQYKKAADAIASYVSYLKNNSASDSQISSMSVWVNISTRQIIKIEYTGTSSSGNSTGTISFSGYNQSQAVDVPSSYSIESDLLN